MRHLHQGFHPIVFHVKVVITKTNGALVARRKVMSDNTFHANVFFKSRQKLVGRISFYTAVPSHGVIECAAGQNNFRASWAVCRWKNVVHFSSCNIVSELRLRVKGYSSSFSSAIFAQSSSKVFAPLFDDSLLHFPFPQKMKPSSKLKGFLQHGQSNVLFISLSFCE